MRLILASSSPRRSDLLRSAGYTFEVQPADVDERLQPHESPSAYVTRLAEAKSARVQELLNVPAPDIVIGADTVVVAGAEILGKPRDVEDAARMLRKLSGRMHQVLTAVSARSGYRDLTMVETTAVQFVPLNEEQIAWYVASGESRDKAGAYAIQGLASRFVARIEGSYTNVVGLPVSVVDRLIQQLGRPLRILASDA